MSLSLIAIVCVILFAAGLVKGLTAMGLPTVGMALLSMVMPPADAAALLVVPAVLTNLAQFATGPRRLATIRRFWALGLATVAGTLLGALLLGGLESHLAPALLGGTLVVYGVFGLSRLALHTPARLEPWLGPVMGLASGVLTGTTGVTVMPVAPFLQSLQLDKEDLVQALGLAFSVSMLALAATLSMDFTAGGDLRLAAASAAALIPSLLGMEIGRRLRITISQAAFRRAFFACLILLGANTLLRAVAF